MKNLRIRVKLIVSFLCVAIFAAIIGGVSFYSISDVAREYNNLYDKYGIPLGTIGDIQILFETNRVELRSMLLDTPDMISKYEESINQNADEVNRLLDEFEKTLETETDIAKLNEIREGLVPYRDVRVKIINMIKANDPKAYEALESELVPVSEPLISGLEELANSKVQTGLSTDATLQAEAEATKLVITIVVVGAVALAIILGFVVTGIIARPIIEIESATKALAAGHLDATISYQSRDELGSLARHTGMLIESLRTYIGNISDVLGAIADGDLTVDVDIDYVGDFAPIKASMEKILASLNNALAQISQASEQVASGSSQVASGAQALSQGSTEQASSVEELSATINEISDQIKHNAENAQEAQIMGMATKREIENGNELMKQLVTAMDDISLTSNQIGKIIKTIDDIAFQTNILALNAAVEAARAGSAGKGFAVVAEEVRNLAGKSAEAAKDTTALIESVVQAIQKGTLMVSETEKSLNTIVEKAEGTVGLITEIAQASNAQASAVTQITQGIEQISSVVQSNSATAEQSAAASEELSSQALALENLIAQFNLRDTGDVVHMEPLNVRKQAATSTEHVSIHLDKY